MVHSDRPADENKGAANFGGVLDGMASLIDKLGQLAEKGEELRRRGDFQSDDGKSVAGSYGFSVKFGPGGQRSDEMKVTPVHTQSQAAPKPTKPETREPHVDTFLEDECVLVVAEMPGIGVEDITLDFDQTRMTLVGKSSRAHFEKVVELEREVSPDDVQISVNNGVVEIQLKMPSDSDSNAPNEEES